jgi:hypothetical protein
VPNLQFEMGQLETADRHIALAERNVAEMRKTLAASRAAAEDTALAERALAAAENGLTAFLEHRELIVTTIDDIRAGRLPSS